MAMLTQCPHCTTAFNVTPEQLFARDGRVRCGQCHEVFDGLVNLTSLEALQAGVPPPLAEAGDPAPSADAPVPVQALAAEISVDIAPDIAPAITAEVTPEIAPEIIPEIAQMSWPPLPDVPEVPLPPLLPEVAVILTRAMEAAMAESAPPAAPQEAMPLAQDSDGVTPAPAVDAENIAEDTATKTAEEPAVTAQAVDAAEEITEAAPPAVLAVPQRAQWPWALAAALAALVLCGQALHAFRNEAAAHFPGVKPALVQLCAWARCTVSPLQKPSALAIQASDLLIQDKAKPHVVQLIVTLQNQSTVDVAYPALDLVLNDRFDHAVARRVFLPADYLRGADAKKTVIGASVATTIRMDLDLGDLAAGGFGLLLIPAPPS